MITFDAQETYAASSRHSKGAVRRNGRIVGTIYGERDANERWYYVLGDTVKTPPQPITSNDLRKIRDAAVRHLEDGRRPASQTEVLKSCRDASVNFVTPARDGGAFEARYVRRQRDYMIVYLSSHSGCDKACRFCHLTATGQTMMQPASTADYLAQAKRVFDHYQEESWQRPAQRAHFNFMARGEPLANDDVVRGWPTLSRKLALEAHRRHLKPQFNLSTIMPVELAGSRLRSHISASEPNTAIYYSLYSMDPAFRRRWLPKAMTPETALDMLAEWHDTTEGEVVLHHALIAGQNDSVEDAEAIVDAVQARGLSPRFNLVRYNPYSERQGAEPDGVTIQRYLDVMSRLSTGVKMVERVGFDVKASCGMFVEAP